MAESATLPALRVVSNDLIAAARTQPQNVEAEQALLGAILVNNVAHERVGEILQAEHFYDPVHGRIYGAISTLINRGQIADPKTLRGLFESDPALTSLGGAQYLADLASSVITIINAEDYARLIHDHYLRRQLITLGEDVVNNAYRHDLDLPATSQIEGTEQKLFELARTGELDRGFVKLEKALVTSLKMAEEAASPRQPRYRRSPLGCAISTANWAVCRNRISLFWPAGPRWEKPRLPPTSPFRPHKAWHDSEGKEGAGTAFFSLEMSNEQLATRLLGEHSSVPSDKIRRGEVKQEDFSKFLEATKDAFARVRFLSMTPLPLVSPALRTRARRLKRTAPHLGLIVIDYLQLLHGTSRRDDNRVQEVSEITRGLKALAKELDIPVVALSQLSRAVEAREDKRPMLSDLRESGSIEQDADVVMFVYREEYYHARSEPTRRQDEPEEKFNNRAQRWMERGEEIRNIAEVLIAKQRHGPIGTVELHFDGPFTRFSNLEKRFSQDQNHH